MVKRLAPEAADGAIEALRVTDRCTCGCSSVGFTEGTHFPAAEGEAVDSDGIPITVMLFADRDEERLATLDVLRADSAPIMTLPSTEQVTIRTVSRWTGTNPQTDE